MVVESLALWTSFRNILHAPGVRNNYLSFQCTTLLVGFPLKILHLSNFTSHLELRHLQHHLGFSLDRMVDLSIAGECRQTGSLLESCTCRMTNRRLQEPLPLASILIL